MGIKAPDLRTGFVPSGLSRGLRIYQRAIKFSSDACPWKTHMILPLIRNLSASTCFIPELRSPSQIGLLGLGLDWQGPVVGKTPTDLFHLFKYFDRSSSLIARLAMMTVLLLPTSCRWPAWSVGACLREGWCCRLRSDVAFSSFCKAILISLCLTARSTEVFALKSSNVQSILQCLYMMDGLADRRKGATAVP